MRVDEEGDIVDDDKGIIALLFYDPELTHAHRFAASQDMQDTLASVLADPDVTMPDRVRVQVEYVLNLSKGVKP